MVLQDDLITVREAARQCQRTTETVRRWIWDGKLPAQKLGNQLFVRRADLARFGSGRNGEDEKAKHRAAILAFLADATRVRERIRRRIGGTLDVLEMLDRSRESHP